MLRLTLILAASIYAGLVIYGAPQKPSVADAGTPEARALAGVAGVHRDEDGAYLLTLDGRSLSITAHVNPRDVIDPILGVTQISTATGQITVTAQDATTLASASAADPADPTVAPLQVASLAPIAAPSIAPVPSPRRVAFTPGDTLRAQVIGSRVNLRAGPSLDDAILASVGEGETLDVLANLGNGWAQIRQNATGAIGFMSDEFLSPLN